MSLITKDKDIDIEIQPLDDEEAAKVVGGNLLINSTLMSANSQASLNTSQLNYEMQIAQSAANMSKPTLVNTRSITKIGNFYRGS